MDECISTDFAVIWMILVFSWNFTEYEVWTSDSAEDMMFLDNLCNMLFFGEVFCEILLRPLNQRFSFWS